MYEGVADALFNSALVDRLVFCGPSQDAVQNDQRFQKRLGEMNAQWIAPARSPCKSVLASLERLPEDEPVLVTTADHALLSSELVTDFVGQAQAMDGDLIFAVADHDNVSLHFPTIRKTVHRLKGGSWCGCNLFYFKNARARRAADYWRRVEDNRKKPLRAARLIGWGFLLKLVLRRMDLNEATRQIGRRMGITVAHVKLDQPLASIDVDSVADLEFVESLLAFKE